jgi:hypothetical protein
MFGGSHGFFSPKVCLSTTPSMNNQRVVIHKSMSPGRAKAWMHKSNEMHELVTRYIVHTVATLGDFDYYCI